MKEFKPEPSKPVKCECGTVVGFVSSRNQIPYTVLCHPCAAIAQSQETYRHNNFMTADRSAIGDEAFVKKVYEDATVQPSGLYAAVPHKFYILSFKDMGITGSSGYSDTREEAWTQMADKIDRYLREPYGYTPKEKVTTCP